MFLPASDAVSHLNYRGVDTLAEMGPQPTVSRRDLLRFRVRRHQLDRPPGNARSRPPDILDYGVQDTGGDGAAWALALRGAPPKHDDVVLAWTLRGAPHAYRRDDIADIAVATAPYTEDDASKRVFTASKPFRAAGMPILDAMRTTAEHQRRIVTKPTVKGDLSHRLAEELDDIFLRWCNPCQTIHPYEQLFRLPALQAGLILDWDTSPPVLRRVPKVKPSFLRTLATDAKPRFEVIRNHLRFFPGARLRDVAEYIDAPIKVVKTYWPSDAVELTVKDDPTTGKAEPRFVLEADVDHLRADGPSSHTAIARSLRPLPPTARPRTARRQCDPSQGSLEDARPSRRDRVRRRGDGHVASEDLGQEAHRARRPVARPVPRPTQRTGRAGRTLGGAPRRHARRGLHVAGH